MRRLCRHGVATILFAVLAGCTNGSPSTDAFKCVPSYVGTPPAGAPNPITPASTTVEASTSVDAQKSCVQSYAMALGIPATALSCSCGSLTAAPTAPSR